MEKIALLTDSSCDLSSDQIINNNILLAPFRIIYSYGEFEDKVNITPTEIYKTFDNEIPTTSLPNMGKVEALLDKLVSEGYTHVIAITISSGLSGTFNALRLILDDNTNIRSYIYDTKTLSSAQGAIVLETAKMIKNNVPFDDIVASLPSIREKTHCYFTLETLEYLIKGGRIGKVSGTIGQMLNLKPIIVVGDDGIYHTHSKVRGRKKALSSLLDIVQEYCTKGKCAITLVQGNSLDDANSLKEKIESTYSITNVGIADVGPALGVHTGPGLIGVVIQEF